METLFKIQIATWIITLLLIAYIIYRFFEAKKFINNLIPATESYFKLKYLEPFGVIRVETVLILFSISIILVGNGVISFERYEYVLGIVSLSIGIIIFIYCLFCVKKVPYKTIGILYDILTSRPIARRLFGFNAPWRIEPGYTLILAGLQRIELLVNTQKKAMHPAETDYHTKEVQIVSTKKVEYAVRIKPGHEVQVLNYDRGEEMVFQKGEEIYNSATHDVIERISIDEFIRFEKGKIKRNTHGINLRDSIFAEMEKEIKHSGIPLEVSELVIGDPSPGPKVVEKIAALWANERDADARNAYVQRLGTVGKKGKTLTAEELEKAIYEYHLKEGWATKEDINLNVTGLDSLSPGAKAYLVSEALKHGKSSSSGKKTRK